MTLVDLWAAGAAAAAAAALAIRGNMLKPDRTTWAKAPPVVWGALIGLAIALAMAVVTILGGSHASQREALIYSVLAVVAGVLLWNLNRNGRGKDLVAMLHGAAGLITTIERRLEPEVREIFRRAVGNARGRDHG